MVYFRRDGDGSGWNVRIILIRREMGSPERRLQILRNRAARQIAGDEHDGVSRNHRLRRPFGIVRSLNPHEDVHEIGRHPATIWQTPAFVAPEVTIILVGIWRLDCHASMIMP